MAFKSSNHVNKAVREIRHLEVEVLFFFCVQYFNYNPPWGGQPSTMGYGSGFTVDYAFIDSLLFR